MAIIYFLPNSGNILDYGPHIRSSLSAHYSYLKTFEKFQILDHTRGQLNHNLQRQEALSDSSLQTPDLYASSN